MTKNITNILKTIPKLPGVYKFFDKNGKIIYVGKSVNLHSRVNSYFYSHSKLSHAKEKMISKILNIETIVTNTSFESLLLETTLIKKYKPLYNILMKDDKNHLYIKITNDIFPKIIKTRIRNNSGEYFGPFIYSNYTINILKLLKKTFGYRNCSLVFKKDKNNKIIIQNLGGTKIPCIYYYIKRCSGPCLLEQSKMNEYNNGIKNIKDFLNGNIDKVLKNLNVKMENYAKNLEFENANKIKNDIESIKTLNNHQIVKDLNTPNCDIINYLEKYDSFFVSRIEIRDTRIVGINNTELKSKINDYSEKINYYIENTYLDNKTNLQILLPEKIEINNEILEKLNLNIFIPKIGLKQEILRLAYKNAFEFAYKKHLDSLSVKGFTKNDMLELLKILGYKKINTSIYFECNDISHISGNYTVASRSVIYNGKTDNSKYRKYKIKSLSKGEINDFDSLREVIKRRLLEIKNTEYVPDLIIIDGGKGQLSSVIGIIENEKNTTNDENFKNLLNKLQLVSIAKKEEELFLPYQKKSILLEKDSNILRMVQKIRDESHRFAITFNRDTRIKESKRNILEELPGFGPKTRKKLLNFYKNIENICDDENLKKICSKNQIETLKGHGII